MQWIENGRVFGNSSIKYKPLDIWVKKIFWTFTPAKVACIRVYTQVIWRAFWRAHWPTSTLSRLSNKFEVCVSCVRPRLFATFSFFFFCLNLQNGIESLARFTKYRFFFRFVFWCWTQKAKICYLTFSSTCENSSDTGCVLLIPYYFPKDCSLILKHVNCSNFFYGSSFIKCFAFCSWKLFFLKQTLSLKTDVSTTSSFHYHVQTWIS